MSNIVQQFDLAFDDSAEVKEGPERTYTQVYDVVLDRVDRNPWHILSYRKTPKLGEEHEFDKAAFVVSVLPARVADTSRWTLTVKYSTNIQDPQNNPNPLERPAKIDIQSRLETVATLFDYQGNLLVNTAGDIIPGERTISLRTITVQKNVAKEPDWALDYGGTVNQSAIMIRKKKYGPRTLRMDDITIPDSTFENGVWYYPLSYTMQFDPRTFDEVKLNQGMHAFVLVPGKVVPGGAGGGGVPRDSGGEFNEFTGRMNTLLMSDEAAEQYEKSVSADSYVKRRITVGSPAEYPSEPQFLDINGKHLPAPKLKDIVVLRRRTNVEKDFSKLILK